MAEQESQDLVLPDQEAGLAFRAEMFIADVFLKYWKALAVAVGMILVGAYVYGTWKEHVSVNQRVSSAELYTLINSVEAIPNAGPVSEEQAASLVDLAARMEAVGADAGGAVDAFARLNAAKAYQRAGDHEARARALQEGLADASGELRISILGALANAQMSLGQHDAAIQTWRELIATEDGVLVQNAALQLAVVLESLDRDAEAAIVLREFAAPRWVNAPLAPEANRRLALLNARANAAEPASDAHAEAPPPANAPTTDDATAEPAP